MSAAPIFSIIVPTFNASATLRACLDSIVIQSCSDFEVVIMDGGSPDDTVEIAEDYTEALAGRLKVHSARDHGPYDAMNRGIVISGGTWVFFLGADDNLYEEATLARVASYIGEQEHSDLVYGDVILRSTSSRYAGAFTLDRLQFQQNICHQSIFYRRELFDSIGPYNLRYPIWADWDFNIRCFSNPALVTQYMDLVVADYNDISGLSASEDEEFKKRLPAFLRAPLSAGLRRMIRHRRIGRV